MLSSTKPCYRLCFMRVTEMKVHEKQYNDGIQNADYKTTETKMTETGIDQWNNIYKDLPKFITGERQLDKSTRYNNPIYFNDGSQSTQLYADTDFNQFIFNKHADLDQIVPVVVVCNTNTLRNYVSRFIKCTDNTFNCPPLGSISMIDVFPTEEGTFETLVSKRNTIHCINSTIRRDVCWWNNAP